ncbi:IclR family transcriptional regulator [Roseomonas elaeocarpi]|uniref:IclR family transcriptional regulator n=1 Tax=Roseomonas elaeocarpi TaxID=907779 RepID=A0ABV6JMZ0_9PROT
MAETMPSLPAPRGPLSMERIFGIITSIASNARGKSLTQLSHELDTPKTSLLNLLPGLTAAGYLLRDGHQYRLGPKAFQLAGAILHSNQEVASIVRPLLQRLATDTGKTVTFCVLAPDERAILHIVKEESRAAMRFVVDEGHRAPLHSTAGGRVILAFRPGNWVERFVNHARLTPQTRRTITSADALWSSIEEVRRVGYAITRGETYDTVGAVAAPVHGTEGFIGAVVAAGAVESVIENEQALSAAVRNTADDLSSLLRGRSASEDQP